MNRAKDPEKFVEKVVYLYTHPNETSQEELEFKDGTILDRYSAPVVGKDGTYFGRIWVFRDVTNRVRAEKVLRESEAQLRAILDATPFPIALVDVQGDNIVFWSRSALTLFGHTAPTATEWYQIAYPDPDYRSDVINRWTPLLDKARLSGQAVNTGEYRITCRDGSVRICELYATFLAERLIVTFNDITERKLAEEALLEAENKFRSFSEQALAGIYLIQDGLFKYVNPRFAQMFGYTVEECLELPFKNLVSPEDLTTVQEQVRRRTSGEIQFVHYTFRGLKKNGVIFYVEIYGSGCVHKGKPAALGTILDITERKQAEETIKRLYNEKQLILNSAGEGILGLDIHGNHTFVNPAAARMLGYAADELIGMHSHTALHYKKVDGSPYAEEECPIYAAYKDGSIHRITEDIFWRKDGTSFPVAYTSTPIIESDTIIGAVVNFRDITKRQKLEAQLLLAQKMEAIGHLAGGIAHDFNNLLQSIIMGIAIAKTRSHEDKVKEVLTQTEAECLKAEELSNLLITFSKGGTPVVQKSSIANMLKEAVTLVLKDSPVNTEFAMSDDLFTVEIDEGQIRIAINQLVMNAKEAMPSGGMLRVQAQNLESIAGENVPLSEGKYIKVTFADNGAGISPENLSMIFDPFFTTKQMGSKKGVGLSLTVSQSIIKKHNGIITAESKAGDGATFHIYLPAAKEG
jgi:PAS domain S-box-containing protein